MNKPGTLRAAIAAAVPDLAANPDKFLVFADEGAIVAIGTKSLSFEYRYTLNMILMDYAGDADTVMIAMLKWVKRNQPELVSNPDRRKNGITFEVDHLNNTSCDLSIKLALTESVKVTTATDGTHTAVHQEEPIPEWETADLA